MIKNYFKIAWRNLLKHTSFSLINILGLSIGIAACMIIFLYVNHELTFDQYNEKADRIARITTRLHTPESDMLFGTSPVPLADALKRDFPEVEATVRLEPSPQVMKLNNEVVKEEAFYTADQSIFSIFSFHFIEGSAANALENSQSIVITQTIAKKYFGNSTALGKTMDCNGKMVLVKGVIKDRPSNSDIRIDALLSADFSKTTRWMDDFEVYTFILFNQQPDLKNFSHKLEPLGIKYAQAELNAQGAVNYHLHFEVEPLTNVHFSQGKLVDTPKGNKQFNYVFSLLAVFILVIALLNYINLSTAKSTERAREVGIRKVSGAGHFQLIRQFLFESVLLIGIAWIAAIALIQIALPFFNKLLQTELAVNWWQTSLFMGSILLITLLMAGIYPAFVLSSFQPVKVLKGNWQHSNKGVMLRKAVTLVQFAIAAALIMGTTVIYSQMKFIEHKDLGFNKNQLMNIYLPRDSTSLGAVKVFQDLLCRRPEIQGITTGSGMTADGMTMASTFVTSAGKKREFMCNYFAVDPYFIPVFQISLLEGRNLSDSFGTDKKEAFIVNEAFVKMMGWKSGIGKTIEGWDHKGKVIGVVKNFYYKSLHNLVEPLTLVRNTFPANTTTVKIKPKDLTVVKAIFKQHFPAVPFDYSFFDEMTDKQYQKDKIIMSLFNNFTVLAIVVSCLGLYGLVALIAVQRTKEISIRKVLGASLRQLFSLQAKGFIKLVCWALLITLPVAGIAMNQWLSAYAYHVPLSWWMFLIPVLLIPLIALAVISREIIKTALVNPVASLKME
jgi:putative ABC transport system permease protein